MVLVLQVVDSDGQSGGGRGRAEGGGQRVGHVGDEAERQSASSHGWKIRFIAFVFSYSYFKLLANTRNRGSKALQLTADTSNSLQTSQIHCSHVKLIADTCIIKYITKPTENGRQDDSSVDGQPDDDCGKVPAQAVESVSGVLHGHHLSGHQEEHAHWSQVNNPSSNLQKLIKIFIYRLFLIIYQKKSDNVTCRS
jgi:hypothetical protein